MQTDSNAYTLIFATIMTVLVAVLLSGLATGLKPIQDAEILLDKKFSIVKSVNPIDKSQADEIYGKTIEAVVIDGSGKAVSGAVAFDIELRKELAKDPSERNVPIYIYTDDQNKKKYILPLFGNGLWDYIGGYLAIEDDFNTIAGVVFTHVGETPGLGAEIATGWFQDQFIGKKLADAQFNFQGVDVLKGRGTPSRIQGKDHKVNGISGATITGDGLDAMIKKCVSFYTSYFKNQKKAA